MSIREDEISVQVYRAMQQAEEPHLLLDVRPPFEHDIANIGGTVIPMNQLQVRIGELEPYRDQPVVVYCRTGSRSGMVVQYLRQIGFAKALNLVGGMHAWADAYDASMPKY